MALEEYKIAYRDGSTQQVTAAQHAPQGEWVIFVDGDGLVLRVPAADVKSISRADIADRVTPGPVIA
jgi:hypothetical protein